MAVWLDFRQALLTAESWGLSDVMLPFLLIFAILFAILTKVRILGDRKGVHVAFALTVALIVVVPHVLGIYPPDRDAVTIINKMIPNVSLVVIAVFAILLLLGIFGGAPKTHHGATFAFIIIFAILFNVFFNETFPNIAPIVLWITLIAGLWGIFSNRRAEEGTRIPGWITVIAFVIVFLIIIFAMGYTTLPVWLEWMRDPTTQAIVIILVIMLAIVGYITRKD